MGASGDTRPGAQFSKDLHTLTLKGFQVDTISKLAPSHEAAHTNHELLTLHDSILDDSDMERIYPFTSEPLLQAYLRTIVADFSAGFDYSSHRTADMGHLATSMGTTYEIVEGLDTIRSRPHCGFAMRWKAGQHEGALNKDGYREYVERQDYRWSLHAAISTQRFFVSAQGYIGLVPEEVEKET